MDSNQGTDQADYENHGKYEAERNHDEGVDAEYRECKDAHYEADDSAYDEEGCSQIQESIFHNWCAAQYHANFSRSFSFPCRALQVLHRYLMNL